MNNLILWIGIIVAVLLLLYFYIKRTDQLKKINDKKKKTSYALDKEKIESFFIEAFRHINTHHNLIENGSLDHGDNANDSIEKSKSGNKITSYDNPSQYPYVLRQEIDPTSDLEKVFYTIPVKINLNDKYLLQYINYTNSTDDIGVIIYTKTSNGTIETISASTETMEEIEFNGNSWVHIRHTFSIPKDSLPTLYISFQTLKNNEMSIIRMIANIFLRRYIPLMPNFQFTDNLRLLLNMSPSSLLINQNYWNNLAYNNGNFKIYGDGKFVNQGLYTRGLKMVSNNSSSLDISPLYNNNAFTLIFDIGPLPNDLIIKEDQDYESILIPGNQEIAFSTKIPNKYGPISFIVADEEFKTDKDIEPNIGGILSFIYGNKTLEIYLNQIQLFKTTTKQVYFNAKDIIINTTSHWAANLKSVFMYNEALLPETIIQVVNWIHNNSDYTSNMKSSIDNESSTTASIRGHVMTSCLGDDCGCSNIPNDWAYTSSADPKYNEKLNNLRNCYLNKLKCPTVKYVSGEYQVTIPEKSLYAKEYNSYGVKNYGSDKDNARDLYMENFPMCLVPDLLSGSRKTENTTSCPFVIEKENPCRSKSCDNVDWNKTKLVDLSQECKNQINQYCKLNWDKDPACLCWNPKYQNEEGCLGFMKYIKDPKDIQIKEVQKKCCLTDYPITDHPDIGKYIEKDNIPCWGCKL